ncbi:pelle-like serine/threonine-protein kinase pik-1 [Planococcus citri]|uniref:pelle-like serine/threonine-protein kinase pik-1 n=1 Tax=Planococcus citri TaxID=170843 RepID=UPI0031F942A9
MSSFRSSSETQCRKQIKYVHELPYYERNELCLCLDLNNKWKALGGIYLNFDYLLLNRYEMAAHHRSPTDSLLSEWASQNGTILKLYKYLHKLHNYQAMKILKPFVDPKYHCYILEEDDANISFSTGGEYNLRNHSSITNPVSASNKNRVSSRSNAAQPPAASLSSQRRSRSGSGDTPATLETNLTKMSLDACSVHIPYRELQEATAGWDRRLTLGRGGFGVVFRGSWKNTAVAIKRLESQRPNDPHYNAAEVHRQQSLRELKYLNNYKHDNILPLYGYSIDGERPCLIYQFMSNGSLEDRLQCRQGTSALSWWQRVTIANGSARGLQFLHSMEIPLIHGDIKSANILLDCNFVPKIGDFGLAKEGPIKDITHVEITKIQGTKPYLPHEFLRGRKLSVKVDTYGFGVVLFELGTGLRAYDGSRKERFLRDHCHEAENNSVYLNDSKAGPEEDYYYVLLIKLGVQCTHDTAKSRPLMADVLKELDNMMENRQLLSRMTASQFTAERRLSIPQGSHSILVPHYLYPSPPASRPAVLSTSPTAPSHLQGPILGTIEGSVVNVQRRISPVMLTPPMSIQNPTNEQVLSHCLLDKKTEIPVNPQVNVQPPTSQPVSDTELSYGTSANCTALDIDTHNCIPEGEDQNDLDNAPIPVNSVLENKQS